MKKVMKLKTMAATAAILLPAVGALAVENETDLTAVGSGVPQTVIADFGGNGLVENFESHPSGTGVFDPFLTLERNASGGNPAGIESAYNTDGHTDGLFLDQQRPEWNTHLRLGDLAIVNKNGGSYYAFELDANEPGADKSLISIDNVRIYTGGNNVAAVQSDETKLDSLGTLRWAMNNPLTPAGTLANPGNYNIDNWIKLNSNLSDALSKANGGSGYSDMILYVPTSAFAGASADDLVWFYNLNGVHYVADGDLAAEAGYEEWRAVLGPNSVPDGGNTLALLGCAFTALAFVAGRRKLAVQA